MTVVLHATVTANNLTPGEYYGLRFEWTGADGTGVEGSISAVKAGTDRHATWPAFPTLFVSVGHSKAPGELKLTVTDHLGNDLPQGHPGAHTAVYSIA